MPLTKAQCRISSAKLRERLNRVLLRHFGKKGPVIYTLRWKAARILAWEKAREVEKKRGQVAGVVTWGGKAD